MKDPGPFQYLWTTPGGRYALLRCGSDVDLMPFDTVTRSVILIEDHELAEFVDDQMRKAGLAIVEPPKDPI